MDDLDDLLDSALDDFQKLDVGRSSGTSSSVSSSSSVTRERAPQFPQDDPPGPSGSDGNSGGKLGQGLGGLGLPEIKGKKKTVRRKDAPSASASSGSVSSGSAAGVGSGEAPPQRPLTATLEKLAQQTRETVGNIAVVDEDKVMGEELVENLMKQFEDLGETQDMQSIMDTMMRQLLSKEVLHEPMKEIAERYPQWLAANKSRLSQEDLSRYTTQHQYILQLCEVYDTKPDDFQKVMDLMQSMQNCGQPPSDIVKELAPGLDFDQDGLPTLPDFSAMGPMGPGGQPPCSIM